MGTLWFWIVVAMLAAYVVLDGFDLGVGIVYLWVARSESERQQAIRSIGPVWDGNEVWLLASGGTIFFAFPLLYASAFSGFYLPLMIVLWLIILRGVSIEMRGHSADPLWRTFFDGVFAFASLLLAVFFGAALANVVRGVDIGPDSYFFLPLWTNWRVGSNPGILDWYTVTGGLLALVALAMHGALYLGYKSAGALEHRSAEAAKLLWKLTGILTAIGIPATIVARPLSLQTYLLHPLLFLVPVGAFISLALIHPALKKGMRLKAFLASCAYLVSMLVGAAAGLFPVLLPSLGSRGQSLTIASCVSPPHTLRVGLAWWCVGMLFAISYFVIVYWMFRGKVPTDEAGYGH